jgi:ribosomal protein S18 acetylase RimI-like enzyme
VTAVEVLIGYRRRGLSRLVLSEIARWGHRRRARSMFLDVGVDNAAAQQLYLSAGFRLHHRYDYLTPG